MVMGFAALYPSYGFSTWNRVLTFHPPTDALPDIIVFPHDFHLGLRMSWFQLPLREQLLVGAAMALTFAVFYVAGLQMGGHW